MARRAHVGLVVVAAVGQLVRPLGRSATALVDGEHGEAAVDEEGGPQIRVRAHGAPGPVDPDDRAVRSRPPRNGREGERPAQRHAVVLEGDLLLARHRSTRGRQDLPSHREPCLHDSTLRVARELHRVRHGERRVSGRPAVETVAAPGEELALRTGGEVHEERPVARQDGEAVVRVDLVDAHEVPQLLAGERVVAHEARLEPVAPLGPGPGQVVPGEAGLDRDGPPVALEREAQHPPLHRPRDGVLGAVDPHVAHDRVRSGGLGRLQDQGHRLPARPRHLEEPGAARPRPRDRVAHVLSYVLSDVPSPAASIGSGRRDDRGQ